MNNFSINTNFNMQGFDNSITSFNKILNERASQTNENLNNIASFDEVMNDIATKHSKEPIQGGVQFIGMDAINAQKIESLSPTAKMASDFKNSISDGLNSLNAINKQAETDLETFASGGDISVHDVMISAQKSQLAMQMAMQLRNQVISAYEEFKNMQF